jgi:CRISPR-associated endoribonuclease Cas6
MHFYLSAPFGQILQEFANQMVRGTTIKLGGNLLSLSSVQVLLPPVFKYRTTKIKMLSPISVHSTLEKKDGGKKTYFYLPTEKEFSELVHKNLLKKYVSFLEKYPEDIELSLRPLFFSEKKNFHLIIYKDYVVKGYSGIYELVGSRELKQFAYDTGLGERNAQGFGMFDIWQKNGK